MAGCLAVNLTRLSQKRHEFVCIQFARGVDQGSSAWEGIPTCPWLAKETTCDVHPMVS